MKLSDLTNHAGEWLRGSGPMSEIVISSRIRLARNVAGIPFLARASRQQKQMPDRDDLMAGVALERHAVIGRQQHDRHVIGGV